MLNFTLSKFRARLLVALGLLAAVLMTNCCPPALLNNKIEKPEPFSIAAKNDVAIATNAPSPAQHENAVETTGK